MAKIALGVNLCLYVPKTLEEESRTSNNAVSLSPGNGSKAHDAGSFLLWSSIASVL
ncbi:unnamed protein product [Brassica napus]|uniref:(rape) hypothetical protein n=1 Tax=Brassica napus TaxID=3708 RepID=A0A816PFC8_BRANA|nr:unnamed protein product [Brassica napus]